MIGKKSSLLQSILASTQGIVAAENIMSKDRTMEASVGMDADAAKKTGYQVVKGRFAYRASGKARLWEKRKGWLP